MSDPTVSGIIENVRANEKLYDNMEYVIQQRYNRGVEEPVGGDAVKSYESNTRVVLQNEMIYLKHDQELIAPNGAKISQDTLQGYDGALTRLVEQNSYANIRHERYCDPRVLPPHLFLLSAWGIKCDFSSYLDGRQQDHEPGYRWSCQYEGEEVLNGIRCFKVRLNTTPTNKPEEIVEYAYFWLAVERNYLVVRSESYNPRLSEKLGVYGETDDWRQIEDGVWLPFSYKYVVYHLETIHEDHVVDNVKYTSIKKASLDPNYPMSLFQDIRFPDGIPVYVVKNGESVESNRQGNEAEITVEPSVSSFRVVLYIVNICIFIAISLFLYRWRRNNMRH